MASKRVTTSEVLDSPPADTPAEQLPSEVLRVQAATLALEQALKAVQASKMFPTQWAAQLGKATAAYLNLSQEIISLTVQNQLSNHQEFMAGLPENLLGMVLVLSRRYWKETKALQKLLPKLHETNQ